MKKRVMLLLCVCVVNISGCGAPPKILLNPQYQGVPLPTITNYKQTLNVLDKRTLPKSYYRFSDGAIQQNDDKREDLLWNDKNWQRGRAYVFWLNNVEILLQLNPNYFMLVDTSDNHQELLSKNEVMALPGGSMVLRDTYKELEFISDFNRDAEDCPDFYEDKTVQLFNRAGDKSVVLRQHQVFEGKESLRYEGGHEFTSCTANAWLSRHCYVSDVLEPEQAEQSLNFDELELHEIVCPGKGAGFLMTANDYKLEHGYLSDDGQSVVGEKVQYSLTAQSESPREQGWIAEMQDGPVSLRAGLWLQLAIANPDSSLAFMLYSVSNNDDPDLYYNTIALKPR